MNLTVEQMNLVENSFRQIVKQSDVFTTSFYNNLFTVYPQTQTLFDLSRMTDLRHKMLLALTIIVNNLDNPFMLKPHVDDLATRHRNSFHVQRIHFKMFHEALMKTLGEILQADWTPELRLAWEGAYSEVEAIIMEQY